MEKSVFPLTAFLVFFFTASLSSYSQSYRSAHTYSDKKLLQDFLCSEITYPEQALSQGIEGKVVLSFIVESDGRVSHFNIGFCKRSEEVAPRRQSGCL